MCAFSKVRFYFVVQCTLFDDKITNRDVCAEMRISEGESENDGLQMFTNADCDESLPRDFAAARRSCENLSFQSDDDSDDADCRLAQDGNSHLFQAAASALQFGRVEVHGNRSRCAECRPSASEM